MESHLINTFYHYYSNVNSIFKELIGRQDDGQSTWSNALKKFKLLWPYVWPKKSALLQFCVLFCMLILIAGRVVNLFTPIYYKYIGRNNTDYHCLSLETAPMEKSPELLQFLLCILSHGCKSGMGTSGERSGIPIFIR